MIAIFIDRKGFTKEMIIAEPVPYRYCFPIQTCFGLAGSLKTGATDILPVISSIEFELVSQDSVKAYYKEVCEVTTITKENKPLQCECGAEKTKSSSHSNWCPKHKL